MQTTNILEMPNHLINPTGGKARRPVIKTLWDFRNLNLEKSDMEQYEYKSFNNSFSAEKVLRQIEDHENKGWVLYMLKPAQFLLLGTGGTGGLMAIMRRNRDYEGKKKN